jgi:hypothetical protein
MAILKRIVSEFWIAFVLALGWAIFRAWPLQSELSWLGTFIANFGAAFFFVSYFTGQFVRVKRQAATEGSFQALQDQLGRVNSAVQAITKKIDESPLAREFADLTARANAQIAQTTSTAAKAFSELRTMGLPWQSDTPLPLRVQHNPAALTPASDYVPVQSPSPTWPPPKPKATGTSN